MNDRSRVIPGVDIERAQAAVAAAIGEGRCVVFPTDTVYGIGADAFNAAAVQGLLDAKRRGRDMPPPILIADTSILEALAADVPSSARRLADAHWPGPLTLILRAQGSLRLDLGETLGTVAVRVPDNEIARSLLRATGPLAVSSANTSGLPPATNVDEALEQLGDSVAVYVDGGPTPGPVPSTIVDCSRPGAPRVFRLGLLSLETLRELVPDLEGPQGEGPDGSGPTGG